MCCLHKCPSYLDLSTQAPKPKQTKAVVLSDSEEDFDVPLMERLKEDSSEDEAVAVKGRKRPAPQKKASKKVFSGTK